MSGFGEVPCEVCGETFSKKRRAARACSRQECKDESRRKRMRMRRATLPPLIKVRDACVSVRRIARPMLCEPAATTGMDCVQRAVRALLNINDIVEAGSPLGVSVGDLKTIATIARAIATSVGDVEKSAQPTNASEVAHDGM